MIVQLHVCVSLHRHTQNMLACISTDIWCSVTGIRKLHYVISSIKQILSLIFYYYQKIASSILSYLEKIAHEFTQVQRHL